jgi:alkylation response protein AidB-like acyl-CoA dehydrogenase
LAAAQTQIELGRPLAQSQSARAHLADLRIRWELARRLQLRSAWQLAHGAETAAQDAVACRLFVADAAARITADAVALLGRGAPEPDARAQRLHRDALALAAMGEGKDVLRSVLAGALLELG